MAGYLRMHDEKSRCGFSAALTGLAEKKRKIGEKNNNNSDVSAFLFSSSSISSDPSLHSSFSWASSSSSQSL